MCKGVSKRSVHELCPRAGHFAMSNTRILVGRVNKCPNGCSPSVHNDLLIGPPRLFVDKRSRVLGIGCSGALSVLRVGPKTTNVSKFRGIEALMHFYVSGKRFGSLRMVRLTSGLWSWGVFPGFTHAGVGGGVGACLIAKTTKFVKTGCLGCVLTGRSSVEIIMLSTLACTNGLKAVTSSVSGRHYFFMGKSVYSHSLTSRLFSRCGFSCVIGFTTRDRMSHDVRGPRLFLRAGVLKARGLLSTTHHT